MAAPTNETRIHPTAVVDAGAEIGRAVSIGPYCVVDAGAVIGDGCTLDAQVRVHGCVTLGELTSVRAGTVLGGEPQDVKYSGEPSRVVIGARCRFHEHVTVHRGTGAGTETVLGDDVMLMAGAHVGHNCRVDDGAVLVNGAMLGGHAHIGAKAFLSGGSGVHQFCRVGRLTLVGGQAAVIKDAPPFSIVSGSYPVLWRAPNTIGLRRAGFTSEQRTAIRHALARLFRSRLSTAEAAAELARSDDPQVVEIARFVLESKRGVCGGVRAGRAAAESSDDS